MLAARPAPRVRPAPSASRRHEVLYAARPGSRKRGGLAAARAAGRSLDAGGALPFAYPGDDGGDLFVAQPLDGRHVAERPVVRDHAEADGAHEGGVGVMPRPVVRMDQRRAPLRSLQRGPVARRAGLPEQRAPVESGVRGRRRRRAVLAAPAPAAGRREQRERRRRQRREPPRPREAPPPLPEGPRGVDGPAILPATPRGADRTGRRAGLSIRRREPSAPRAPVRGAEGRAAARPPSVRARPRRPATCRARRRRPGGPSRSRSRWCS